LEARKRAAPKPVLPPIGAYLIAHFGGHYDGKRSPRESYAAALDGCKDGDLRATLERFDALTPEQRAERHGKALERLLKRRKLEPMLRKLAKLMP
jgi:hypothetical protein